MQTARTMLTAAEGVDDSMAVPGCSHAGPWRIEREIGRGGMCVVYAVVHDRIRKRAALKVLRSGLLLRPSLVERVLLEAQLVNEVGHPNIIDIFESGTLADGRPYVVMEHLDGMSLARAADAGKLPPDVVISILLQLCGALTAAHNRGVIHRDLKLDNVFLVPDPSSPDEVHVKLLDWGIAKVLDEEITGGGRFTQEGELIGTPEYLAPEQARGGTVTAQTDVYSLGVMAYELFLGIRPFEADDTIELLRMHLDARPPPPHELWPAIPRVLDVLLQQMLAKQPEVRPTMAAIAEKLEVARAEIARRRHDTQRRLPLGTPLDAAQLHMSLVPTVATIPTPMQQPHVRLAPRKVRWVIGTAIAVVGALASVQLRASGAPTVSVETVSTAAAAPPPVKAPSSIAASEIVTPSPVRVVAAPAVKPTTARAAPRRANVRAVASPSTPAQPSAPSVDELAAQYQRVGRALKLRQDVHGRSATEELWARFRWIRISDALRTPDQRAAATTTLANIERDLAKPVP